MDVAGFEVKMYPGIYHRIKEFLKNRNYKGQIVSVYPNCLTAKCLQGIDSCNQSQFEKPIDLPIDLLSELGLENKGYWRKDDKNKK